LPVRIVSTAIMKIRIVNSRDEIASLDPEERVVHLATPPIALAFEELIKRCSQLEAIQVPPSRFRNVSSVLGPSWSFRG